ncbi:MAG: hypothetical protein HDT47_09545 [Ruminococcaceae bacterium]|nr:hypothetical protein [Oscillospiraceae bacterium]
MSVVDIFSFYQQLESDYREMSEGEKDRRAVKKEEGEKISNADKKVRESFLYQYLKSKKEADARQISADEELLFSASDKYTRLKGAYFACENKTITKEKYRDIFFELNGGVKMREKLFDADPDAALDQLGDRLLKDSADDFIHNGKAKLKKHKIDYSKGTRIDMIEMLHEFNMYTKSVSFAGASNISDDYIEKCETLYKIIRRDGKRSEYFIPLYIDKDSGAGVYIIGNDILNMDEAKVCVLVFSAAYEADDPFIPIDAEYTICSSARDAFKKIKRGIETGEYFNGYSEHNGDTLPENVDECFGSRFFDSLSIKNSGREEIKRKYSELEIEGIKKIKEDE